jgi:tRNA A-37 threonylcarbamoyl transferase component Bud32
VATCPTCQGGFDNATFCPRDGTRLDTTADAGALLGGRYRLLRKIGEGAMGVVFEAEHVSIRRRVAVKILQRKLVASPEMVERLRREAQVTSGLGHPNIVECLDFGTEEGQVYLVMEWLDGETLGERLEREPIDFKTVLDIGEQTCAGLAEAHERGVIHRDLKPANLFLTRDRAGALRVKILDFGIAKLVAEQTQLTSTGVLVGTPNYMAPEQALGEAIDARADIYSLGVILYELLVGRVPFQGDTPLAVLHQHTAKMPALPSAVASRSIATELDTVVMTCLAKAPADRYQTAAELGTALQAAHRAEAAPAPPKVSTPSRPPEPDDIHDEVRALRPRRSRVVVMMLVVLGALAAGFAIVVGLHDHHENGPPPATRDAAFVPSSLVDAALLVDAISADVPQVDAGEVTDASTRDARPSHVIHNHTPRFAVDAELSPYPAHHDQPITLAIVASELDEVGRQALAAGTLRARVTVEHFARHDVVAREIVPVDAERRAKIEWVPRHGKHHVSIELLAETTSLGRARFDVHAE